MTGITHVAIAVSCGIFADANALSLSLLAGGALIPDLDTSRSTIGRIFLPISIPLEKWLGHRGAFHSFWLWFLLMGFGILWRPVIFIAAGCLLHVYADCATVSGVRAMTPWSNKLFVFFKRSWRLKTGSNAEFGVLVIFAVIAYSGHQVSSIGGIAAAMGYLTNAPRIMFEEYRSKGLAKCTVKGKFRLLTGEIIEGEWLIIGMEGSSGIAFLVEDKIIRQPDHGFFLKARLKTTGEVWKTAALEGWYETKYAGYFMDGKSWHRAFPGDVVWGSFIADRIGLSNVESIQIMEEEGEKLAEQ